MIAPQQDSTLCKNFLFKDSKSPCTKHSLTVEASEPCCMERRSGFGSFARVVSGHGQRPIGVWLPPDLSGSGRSRSRHSEGLVGVKPHNGLSVSKVPTSSPPLEQVFCLVHRSFRWKV